METNNPISETSKRPVAKLRIGLNYAYVWPRDTEKGVFYSVSFERRYRDADGKWQSAFSFGYEDLLDLAKLADLAHSTIMKRQTSEG